MTYTKLRVRNCFYEKNDFDEALKYYELALSMLLGTGKDNGEHQAVLKQCYQSVGGSIFRLQGFQEARHCLLSWKVTETAFSKYVIRILSK